jgi:hypothetical protein
MDNDTVPPLFCFPYSETAVNRLLAMGNEAQKLFPSGKIYSSADDLRKEIRSWATKKGFSITSEGAMFACSRCVKPQSTISKQIKRQKIAPVPPNNQRKHNSTRVNCPFQIRYSPCNRKVDGDKSVKITTTNYLHDNGCNPSSAQLAVEKRKSGIFSVATHEGQIRSIMTLLGTGTYVPTSLLREMMLPMYPSGTSLDSRLIFNFRVKMKLYMLRNPTECLSNVTVTEQDQASLLVTDDVSLECPQFLTNALCQFKELLKDAMTDHNDLHQIRKFLKLMSDVDDTFTYRQSLSDDGSATGFVWQTGVMRRDFELFGDVLFVDCLGRSINEKGWPINTIAMLDGDKKVCLPCEGLTIGESVDSYAWLIKSAVSMAPGRRLEDIRVIYSDGINGGETLLDKLGIRDSCKIVLDHHHLLSEKLGAWPKEFGLAFWPVIREPLSLMVKSYEEEKYIQGLNAVRQAVSHNDKWLQYVENNIHAKRHMFANHLVKTYSGNLHRSGNAPAESNHASIISRLGSLVATPPEIVCNLINRHKQISSERCFAIRKYNMQCMAKSMSMKDINNREALLTLNSYGYKWYDSAMRYSKTLLHETDEDTVTYKDRFDGNVITLKIGATTCSCRRWIATNASQCAHLLLLHNGCFVKSLWSEKWYQRTDLDVSRNVGFEKFGKTMSDIVLPNTIVEHNNELVDTDDVHVNAVFEATEKENADPNTVLMEVDERPKHKMTLRDMMDVCCKFAYAVNGVRDPSQQQMYMGAVVKLTEFARGNYADGNFSLEQSINKYLSLFTQNLPQQDLFSATSSQLDKTSTTNNMSNGATPGTNGGCRLQSKNERIVNSLKNSTRRTRVCSLCMKPGHRAGRNCLLLKSANVTKRNVLTSLNILNRLSSQEFYNYSP